MGLHWKSILTYISVIAIFIITGHLYLDWAIRGFLVEQVGNTLAKEVRLIGTYIAPKFLEPLSLETVDKLTDLIESCLEVQTTVINGEGRVLGDSKVSLKDLQNLGNHADRSEVQDTWIRGRGRSLRYSEILDKKMLYVARAIPSVGDGRLVMRLAVPLHDVRQLQSQIHSAIWTISSIGIGVVLVLLYGQARSQSRSIVHMKEVVQAMVSGNFSRRLRISEPKSKELRNLLISLDSMREQIQAHIGQIAEEKSRMEAVLLSITEGVLVTKRNGRVQMVNRAFERIFRTSMATKDKLPVELIRYPEIQEAIDRTLESGNETAFEMISREGLDNHLDVHVAPILKEGTCIGSVTVFYDISELRRLERVRKDFVANVSHELRTPLTVIKGCASTLSEGALADPEMAERFVQTIVNHADRLHYLVEDVLDLSKMESGHLDLVFQICDAKEMVEIAVGSVQLFASEKGIKISVEVPKNLKLKCDQKMIQQALFNLLDNAIKFTAEGGSVQILARKCLLSEDLKERFGLNSIPVEGRIGKQLNMQTEEEKAKVVLEVIDTGVGIPLESLSRVFERFYRVDQIHSGTVRGTGLGLSIVRHIVESHGEEVYVQSKLNQGSTFGFTMSPA